MLKNVIMKKINYKELGLTACAAIAGIAAYERIIKPVISSNNHTESEKEDCLKDDVDYIVKGSLLKAAFSINELLTLEKILKVNHTKK